MSRTMLQITAGLLFISLAVRSQYLSSFLRPQTSSIILNGIQRTDLQIIFTSPDVKGVPGDPGELTCTLSSPPGSNTTCTWIAPDGSKYIEGAKYTDGKTIKLEQGSFTQNCTLQLDSIEFDDVGPWACKFQNSVKSKRKYLLVDLPTGEKIVSESKEVFSAVGEEISLICPTTIRPRSRRARPTCTWLSPAGQSINIVGRNGEIFEYPSFSHFGNIDRGVCGILIKQVSSLHQGTWTCRIQSKTTSQVLESSAKLTIGSPTDISGFSRLEPARLRNTEVRFGGSFTIPIRSEILRVYWIVQRERMLLQGRELCLQDSCFTSSFLQPQTSAKPRFLSYAIYLSCTNFRRSRYPMILVVEYLDPKRRKTRIHSEVDKEVPNTDEDTEQVDTDNSDDQSNNPDNGNNNPDDGNNNPDDGNNNPNNGNNNPNNGNNSPNNGNNNPNNGNNSPNNENNNPNNGNNDNGDNNPNENGGNNRPNSGNNRPNTGNNRPNTGNNRPNNGNNRPNNGKGPNNGNSRPNRNTNNGSDRPNNRNNRPNNRNNRPKNGNNRPNVENDRPKKSDDQEGNESATTYGRNNNNNQSDNKTDNNDEDKNKENNNDGKGPDNKDDRNSSNKSGENDRNPSNGSNQEENRGSDDNNDYNDNDDNDNNNDYNDNNDDYNDNNDDNDNDDYDNEATAPDDDDSSTKSGTTVATWLQMDDEKNKKCPNKNTCFVEGVRLEKGEEKEFVGLCISAKCVNGNIRLSKLRNCVGTGSKAAPETPRNKQRIQFPSG